jgi:hypothetical protein
VQKEQLEESEAAEPGEMQVEVEPTARMYDAIEQLNDDAPQGTTEPAPPVGEDEDMSTKL